ncbi:hypothetical protein FE257_010989 [Aspergillus nanangensis]|uniref:RanBD1 domain-containing protein n=1 Tax=Aspergillus nanangensis TaxID=2582783 RepID=A0AAD4CI06_ASPNN|nr:hypothetical protein FE257_010989 [Aspergillus nanangensis]
MSKRGAQGPQGDKDSNLFDFNMQSTPEEKPQRATAAQLASRKISQPRRRRPNTSSSTPGASFSGPFTSLDPNTVSSTQGPSQPATNGFSFGQSQSFPGAGPNSTQPSQPSQPSQNGSSPFAFGSGGGGSGSSSFNFSSSFGGPSATPNNPFATSGPSDGGSFSGFKGNMFNPPATGSSTPAAPSFSSAGLFGAGQQPNNPTGGLFGSSSSAATQPGTTAPTTTSIFGQSSASTAPAPPTNIFGPAAENKPSPFGQSTAFGDSMQTSPDAKNNAAQSKPALFGAGGGSSGFGTPTSFSGPGTGSLFGTSTAKPAETPSKNLFGAKPAEQSTPSSSSIFGATTQPTSTATPAPSTSLFGTASTAKSETPSQNSLPTANIFGTPASATPKPAGGATEGEKAEDTQPKPVFGLTPSTSTGASLFSNAGNAAVPTASAGGLLPPPTGNLFSPKPVTADQNDSKPAGANPFASLFTPAPASEQKPLPSPAAFGNNLFSPKPAEGTASVPEKSTTAAPLFSASTSSAGAPKPSSSFPQQAPVFSASPVEKPQALASTAPAPFSSPFKTNGSTPITQPSATTGKDSVQIMAEAVKPSKMQADLIKDTKDDVEFLYRISLLNESFKNEISQLDPFKDSFDAIVLFYMRVRETIGAPVGDLKEAYKKRKSVNETTSEDQPFKKAKPGITSSSKAASSPASTKLFGASQSTPTSTKRKLTEDDDISTPPPEKRVNGDSSTADIFAQSFSKSKSSDSADEQTDAYAATPSTPATDKAAMFSTTPTTSPAKPLFPTSSAQRDSSSPSLFSQPPSAFKPASSALATDTAPANPFVLKPSGGNGSTSSTAAAPGPPKFGTGTTDFFAQFKAQAEKDADKEKAKRKADDFDSDEEDEAEWERRDAEEQEKKRKEMEAQQVKRSKFVPGKGFVFEDESNDVSDGKAENASSLTSTTGTSVFDKKSISPAKSSNIFGHLSGTPSEAEEEDQDADDTEEASTAGDDDIAKDPSFPPTSEDESTRDAETSETESKGLEFSANESGDDGDLTKAIEKSKKATESGSGGRSLFDRVQYDQGGKLKRQGDGEQKNTFSVFGSQGSSSFNSPTSSTPNPFASLGKPQTEQSDSKTSSTNIFGAAQPTGSLFGSPVPTSSGNSTPSIFGVNQSTPKAGADHTWKINSPIKFATDSNTSSPAKPESDSTTPASDPSKPLSTLFGGAAAGSKESTGNGQQTLGFSFGAPSQQSSSFLAPSSFGSATPSRGSTPGVTSDTGAEESGDGDTAEKLPQVDLARSGAGEEDEDVVFEARARGLKLSPGEGWESQGVGLLRILKNRTTSRGRVLLRATPSGNIVLNAALQKAIEYKANDTSVQFIVPKSDGPPDTWALRTKKAEVEGLAAAMQETKQ